MGVWLWHEASGVLSLEGWGCLWELSGFGFRFFWTILNINHRFPQVDLIRGESITTKDVENHFKP